jgi:clan AA aspartic protease (TIGR02281 family)
MKNESETKADEIRVGDFDRWFAEESSSRIYGYTIAGVVALCACAAIYFYPQLKSAWINLGPQTQNIVPQTNQAVSPQIAELSSTLGVSNVPPAILSGPDLDVNFDRLRRENCDRTAMLNFATKLAEVGYPRDAANALTTFASRCGNGDDALWAAATVLTNISDYNGVIKITSGLVESIPTSPDVRYARGQAFQAVGKFEQAISDYVSTIELVPNIKDVSSKVFTDLASAYASLKRYCEAINPIQMYVAADPSARDTTQARALIADYAKKGACELEYAKGSDRFFAQGGDVIKAKAEINGVSGTFIIDTGASLVSLTSSYAKRAKVRVDEADRVRLQSANGTTEGVMGVAQDIRLGRLRAKDVAAVVTIDNAASFGRDVDGLLGMPFLARYEIVVSGGEIRLKERRF